jgi:putative restriction endonuclease
LLVLLALGRLSTTGSSALPWSDARSQLGKLIAEFGPASKTSRAQSAAYRFTRLRSDGLWILDRDVPHDTIGPLAAQHVTGRFDPTLEAMLASDPQLIASAARALVESHFPDTVAPDVLSAVGLEPSTVLHAAATLPDPAGVTVRRRARAGGRRSSRHGIGSAPSVASTVTFTVPRWVWTPPMFAGSPSTAQTASTTV